MKLKNIFLLTVMIGLLFSCASEELLEAPSLKSGETSQIDLTLSMGDMITKAGEPAPNYTYATLAEITVSDCVIAIFDKAGDRVFYKEASGSDLTSTDHESEESMTEADKKVLTYHVKDVEIPWGTDMTVIVVANSAHLYSTYKTLTAFQAAVETTGDFTNPTFDPTRLVKVGIRQMDITTSTTKIEVPMIQLAARVDLNLAITATDGLDVDSEQSGISYELADFVEEMSKKVIKREISIDNSETGPIKEQYPTINVIHDAGGYPGKSYVFFPEDGEVQIPNNGQIVKIMPSSLAPDGQWLMQKVLTRKVQWGLSLNSITIENILLKSNVLLPKWSTLYHSNAQESVAANMGNLIWTNPAEGEQGHIDTFANEKFVLTFYTYEKEFAYAPSYDENPLRIVVDADIIQSSVSTVERYGSLHGVWYYKDKDKDKVTILNNENKAPASTVLAIIPGSESDLIAKTEVIETVGTPYPKKFAFIINPQTNQPNYKSYTDGVIHGNLYSVAATVKDISFDTEIDLEYIVNSWVDVPAVDINYN